MRYHTLISLLLIALNSYGQYDFTVGTRWTYSKVSTIFNEPKSLELNLKTEILGNTWFGIQGVDGCAAGFKDVFIRSEGDKMYYLSDSTEMLLYDFSLKTGDAWSILIPNSNDSFQITIDSIGEIEIGTESFEVQYINDPNFGDYIINGIGSNTFLFPQGNLCDPQYFGIRCFNNGINELDFDPNHECEDSYHPTQIRELLSDHQIEVFPNPAKNWIQVDYSIPEIFNLLNIYDSKGILACSFNNKLERYDISALSSGIYLLEFVTDHCSVFKRFIIH